MEKRARAILKIQLKFYGGNIAMAFNSLSDANKDAIITLCGDIIDEARESGYSLKPKYSRIEMVSDVITDWWMKTKTGYYDKCWELSNINAKGLPDIKNRRWGKFDLDHIVPISYGYRNNIPIELIASKANLRVISHRENFEKNARITDESIEILTMWRESGLIK
jgi:hypothetical protein